LTSQATPETDNPTLTDQLRARFAWLVQPIAAFMIRRGIGPNLVTIAGLIGTIIGSFFLSQGRFTVGALIIGFTSFFDAIDGTMARLLGEPQNFGAFVDSVSDRYSELIIFAALLWYSIGIQDNVLTMAVYFAAFGSVLVSYTRARAQSLEMEAKIGWFSRVERIAVLGLALLFGFVLEGVLIVGVGANITALQRVIHVRRQAHAHQSYRR
jgi:CDP-diacylglycerol--glycerol-3-phosphate 3-phosphatidyltransferase